MKYKLVLVAALLLLASVALADAGSDRIRGLSEQGGSSEWDAKVRLIMLANYDLDGSGFIDKNPEVDMIPCGTWKALDDGVKVKWSYGVRVIYGFMADKIWIGDALGFAETVRAYADSKLVGCESSGWTTAGGGGGGSAPALSGPPHEQIMAATPGQGGKSPWDAAVKPILLGHYDTNGSGSLDTTEEILGIPCETFVALDARVREGWGYSLRLIYGFQADKIWVGDALGFAESARSGADMRAASCEGGVATPVPTPAPSTGGSVASQIRARPETGGQSPWDEAVMRILVAAYDANRSGLLDTATESQALSCDDWKAIDDGVKVSWDYGVRTIYGFAPGYIWIGSALGFSESFRTSADADLVACLEPGTVTSGGTDPASQIRALPNGGSSEWDAAVKPILLGAYDANRSGSLDTAAEVSSIPCDVWSAMDVGVKSKYTYGIRPIYGFEDGYSWVGYAIGFSESVRRNGDSALLGCGLGE